MTDATLDFYLLYKIHRHEITAIARRLRDALDEDHLKNADMFDITRTTFSQSKHPNATMRVLEKDLLGADLSLLCMLVALSETGMELTQGLTDFPTPTDFARFAADINENLQKLTPSAAFLAQKLTEIKPEHALKRLDAATKQMDLIRRKENYNETY